MALAVLTMWGSIYATGYSLYQGTWGNRSISEIDHPNAEELWIAFAMVGLSVLAGLFARLALRHRSAKATFITLLSIVFVWMILFDVFEAIENYVTRSNRTQSYIPTLLVDAPEFLVLCFAGSSVLVAAGVLLGSALLTILKRIGNSPTRRLIRKLRKRKRKQD